ncbi:hypothetical protein ACB098_05G101800 [Castanea mollissima]
MTCLLNGPQDRCDFHLFLSNLHCTIPILAPPSFPFFPVISCQKYTNNSPPIIMSSERLNDSAEGSSRSTPQKQQQQQPAAAPPPLSRYESQKRRDWNTFGQYLRNQTPPVSLSQCNCNHVLDFLRQAWGSLDALIGRLRAAYEEHGGSPETNPFGNGAIRVYLREVKECQSKARGIPYKKKKKKRNQIKAEDPAKSSKQAA